MRSLSGALLLLGFAAPIGLAQSSTTFVAAPAPTHIGTYDLHTGIITTVSGGDAGTTTVYDNTTANGFFFTPGPGLMSMDWGSLSAAGNNFISRFQVGYGTTTVGTVDMGVRFHEGGAGFGTLGAVVGDFLITGLPGSVAGEVVTFTVDIDLSLAGAGFDLADGAIGYSYEFFDSTTGPLLIGPPNEAGVADAFDQYDLGFGYLGTFFFGGPPNPLASFHMQLSGGAEPPECFLLIGFMGNIDLPLPWSPEDHIYLVPDMILPVTFTDIPTFHIPNEPALTGLSLYGQVYMDNPFIFPGDQWKTSNAVDVQLGVQELHYGQPTGMQLWLAEPPMLGADILFQFSIDGF